MRIFIFSLVLVLALVPPASAGGRVEVNGTQITVRAKFALRGDMPPQLGHLIRQVLEQTFNRQKFLYKCYDLRFALSLETDPYAPDGDATDIWGVDVQSSQTPRDTHEAYGLYDLHDWDAYDREHGTDRASICTGYEGGYDPQCAFDSQWFHDRGGSEVEKVLGHASSDRGARKNGTIKPKRIVVPSDADYDTIAHEIGHALGFEHTSDDQKGESDYTLMGSHAGPSQSRIPIDNLHDMLRRMGLECEWELGFTDINYTFRPNLSGCKADCIANTTGEAGLRMLVKSHGLALTGEGNITYRRFDVQGCNLKSASTGGKFNVDGGFHWLAEDKTEPTSDHLVSGYRMELKLSHVTPPAEMITTSVHTYLKNLIRLSDSQTLSAIFKAPDADRIVDPWSMLFEMGQPLECGFTDIKFWSSPLELYAVRPYVWAN